MHCFRAFSNTLVHVYLTTGAVWHGTRGAAAHSHKCVLLAAFCLTETACYRTGTLASCPHNNLNQQSALRSLDNLRFAQHRPYTVITGSGNWESENPATLPSPPKRLLNSCCSTMDASNSTNRRTNSPTWYQPQSSPKLHAHTTSAQPAAVCWSVVIAVVLQV